MKTRILLMLVSLLLMPIGTLNSQTIISKTVQYPSNHGQQVILRSSVTNHDTVVVTCYHTPTTNAYASVHSSFIVRTPSVCKMFTTRDTSVLIGFPTRGYIVEDMKIIDDICYFCGTQWQDYGSYFFSMSGDICYNKTYKGIVGRFHIGDVITGSGDMEILVIDTLKTLKKMELESTGITAIGISKVGDTTCIVEVDGNMHGGTSSWYNYRLLRSVLNDEVFNDLTYHDGTIATVSRFDNTYDPVKYRYNYGIRKGEFLLMRYTGVDIYNYDVRQPFGDDRASFHSVNGLHICLDNEDKYLVSYVGNNATALQGHLILFYHLGVPGLNVNVQYSYDSEVYTKLFDLQRNKFNSNFDVVALLESQSDTSTLRFPALSMNGIYVDSVLYTRNHKLQSFASRQLVYNDLHMMVGGYDVGNTLLVNYLQSNIHNTNGCWTNRTCFSYRPGLMSAFDKYWSPKKEKAELWIQFGRDKKFDVALRIASKSIKVEQLCQKKHF